MGPSGSGAGFSTRTRLLFLPPRLEDFLSEVVDGDESGTGREEDARGRGEGAGVRVEEGMSSGD